MSSSESSFEVPPVSTLIATFAELKGDKLLHAVNKDCCDRIVNAVYKPLHLETTPERHIDMEKVKALHLGNEQVAQKMVAKATKNLEDAISQAERENPGLNLQDAKEVKQALEKIKLGQEESKVRASSPTKQVGKEVREKQASNALKIKMLPEFNQNISRDEAVKEINKNKKSIIVRGSSDPGSFVISFKDNDGNIQHDLFSPNQNGEFVYAPYDQKTKKKVYTTTTFDEHLNNVRTQLGISPTKQESHTTSSLTSAKKQEETKELSARKVDFESMAKELKHLGDVQIEYEGKSFSLTNFGLGGHRLFSIGGPDLKKLDLVLYKEFRERIKTALKDVETKKPKLFAAILEYFPEGFRPSEKQVKLLESLIVALPKLPQDENLALNSLKIRMHPKFYPNYNLTDAFNLIKGSNGTIYPIVTEHKDGFYISYLDDAGKITNAVIAPDEKGEYRRCLIDKEGRISFHELFNDFISRIR